MDTTPSSSLDQLVEPGSDTGLVILNYADPAFPGSSTQSAIDRSSSIFLHTLSYLLFADAVCVPSRYMLDGDDAARATTWSQALLEEGILIPERRHGPTSFEDLARERRLSERAMRRGEYLDRHVLKTRSFKYDSLSETYVSILASDLARGGAFGKLVPGGLRGESSRILADIGQGFQSVSDGTPESFAQAVGARLPRFERIALKWAMSRYYLTPTQFDTLNTREIPSEPSELLVKAGVLDPAMPRFSAAPADQAYERMVRLAASVPALDLTRDHRKYTEALLEVRREVPQARTLFEELRDQATAKDLGDSMSAMFESELRRQLGVRTTTGHVFTLVSSLVSGAVGFGAGVAVGSELAAQAGAGLASSVIGGYAATRTQSGMKAHRERKKTPWLLAMDRFEAKTKD